MGLIDKWRFEARGSVGCSNSDYRLHRTTCCGAYCVEDDELLQLYFDPADLSRNILLIEGSPCPICGSQQWDLTEVEDMNDVPPDWLWACKLG